MRPQTFVSYLGIYLGRGLSRMSRQKKKLVMQKATCVGTRSLPLLTVIIRPVSVLD